MTFSTVLTRSSTLIKGGAPELSEIGYIVPNLRGARLIHARSGPLLLTSLDRLVVTEGGADFDAIH